MTKRKVIVSERDNIAALFEDDRAVEFVIHRGDMLLGDVYLCTVENVLPSIDAAFVNVGGEKMGFLHSSDAQGRGDLTERLKPKQKLVVQVMKEPTGHKGPRVTTNISLPGRFLVLMPESKGISISRKIDAQKERSRLKAIVSMVKPHGVGVIIRTEANNQKESDIQEDFETLLERWQNIVAAADTSSPPALLYRDQDLLYRVIREVVTEDVTEIVVDTAFGQQRAQQLLQNWNLDKNIKVTLHAGAQSILVATSVEREIKLALNTKVPLPCGGYLYVQPTEALTVIDVNSGKFTSLKSQAETIRLTNLEACKEIARQLRLRNIGGMIVVDFIDMESRADQLSILEAFENELAPDKSKPQMGQLTDLGLVEMTRHRQGQSLSEIFTHHCSSCDGTGHAIDTFGWSPPNTEGDPRINSRFQRGGGRDRGANGNRGGRDRGGAQQGGNRHAAPLVTPGDRATRFPLNGPPSEGSAPAGQALRPQAGRPPQPPSGNRPDARRPNDFFALEEKLRERTLAELGVRFAYVAKFSSPPAQANYHLARINPRANDILTLIQTIESGGMAETMDEDVSRPEGEMSMRPHEPRSDFGDLDVDDMGLSNDAAASDALDESLRESDDMEDASEDDDATEDAPASTRGRLLKQALLQDAEEDWESLRQRALEDQNDAEEEASRRSGAIAPPADSEETVGDDVDDPIEEIDAGDAENGDDAPPSSDRDAKPKRRRGRPVRRAKITADSNRD